MGERGSRRKGGAAEFMDHRAYSPGDDPRRIDWHVYARTGEPFVKLFRKEEDSVVRLVVDASGSMRVGEPEKLHAAKKLAAGIGYMVMMRLERAELCSTADGRLSREAPLRGRGGVAPLLGHLSRMDAEGRTNLARAIDVLLSARGRPGALVVVSDFFDPGPVLAALGRARAAGHELSLIHVVAPEEEEPTLDGDLTLVDVETGDAVDITADPAALEAYALRFAGLCEELRSFARRTAGAYVRTRTDAPLEEALARFVAREVD